MKLAIWWWLFIGTFVLIEGHAYFFGAETLTDWARGVTVKRPYIPWVFLLFLMTLGWHIWREVRKVV